MLKEHWSLEDRGRVILDMQVHYLLSRIYRELGEKELAAKYTSLSQQAEITTQRSSALGALNDPVERDPGERRIGPPGN